MKTYKCAKCRGTIYFENVKCLRCKAALGFDPATLSLVSLTPANSGPGHFVRYDGPKNDTLAYCDNARHGVCNWLVKTGDGNSRCLACDLNRTIPNLSEPGNLGAWRAVERAKKRLVYSLLRLGLPLDGGASGKGPLTFDFKRDTVTGHLDGVVTIDVIEADSVARERQRQLFGEPYRSLLGHLRHESGHYYWMLLFDSDNRLTQFRELFGNEQVDYGTALSNYYERGVAADWQKSYVSAYASSHPWEDWAETWAHYLHMIDTLETAEAEGMEPRAAGFALGTVWPFIAYDIYSEGSFDDLMARWIPLTVAMNSLNRSMGHSDFYPFVITPPARAKLRLAHAMIRAETGRLQ